MNVSIIIPVHNSEKYLEECVNSVLPGMNEDDEIILVENGSSDSSWAMCRNYSSQYPNIRAVSLDASGVSIARNKGILLAGCEWLCFLDSDDVMDPGFLSAAHRIEKGADIVLFQYCYMNKGEGVSLGEDDPLVAGNVDPDLLRRAALELAKYQKKVWEEAHLDYVTIWSACAKLIRREMVRENKIHFPEKLFLTEDAAFSLQLYCCAEKVIRVEQNAFFYRETETSAVRVLNPRTHLNNQYLRKWIYYYIRKKGYYGELSREVSSLLSRKLVEECFHMSEAEIPYEEALRYIKENASEPFMRKSLREAEYRYIIAGKRNALRYFPILWLLKRRLYRLILMIQS